MLNRRSFLSRIGLVVAGVAIEQAVPLGRVWSFPKEIKRYHALPCKIDFLGTEPLDFTGIPFYAIGVDINGPSMGISRSNIARFRIESGVTTLLQDNA